MINAVLENLVRDKKMGLAAEIVRFLLWVLSFFYGLAVSILIWFYRLKPVQLGCKVISVGNITVGGTGKTVMAQLIAQYLKSKGYKAAILSRGYKRLRTPNSELRTPNSKARSAYENMGDEPLMMFEKLQNVPVLVGSDRVRLAKTAIVEYAVDTLILDDGFQQWRIKKDLEIVMFDGANPFGNHCLLPRGILRQPKGSLKSADIFVLTNTSKSDLNSTQKFLSQINPQALILEARHSVSKLFRLNHKKETLSLDFLKGQPVALFCGLGNPNSFRDLIRESGLKEELFFEFPDHYHFSEKDLEKMVKESASRNIRALITTEKDAVRIPLAVREKFGENIFVLAVELKFKDEEQRFFNRLLRVYSA